MGDRDLTIRAVIFDVYGTLLEVGPPPADADARWRTLFEEILRMEPPLSRQQFAEACTRVIARHHELARSRGIPWPEVWWPAIVAEVLPHIAQLPETQQQEFLFRQTQTWHTTQLRAEAAEAIRRFRARGCLLGIASNSQAYTLRELQEGLAGQGLTFDIFERDLCFWSFQHGFSKPDPHVFQILTVRLAARGIAPPQTLMVGDRPDHDLEPARAYGWQTWHLSASAAATDGGDWSALLTSGACRAIS